uniref:30S ribosomal protein S4 n=1 Tax=Nephromyces sp. ex Molgula occidentalis TaxID=2544991 RepID=A0A5C1HAL9_9APIC|nr:30S ribosomal protein S4 [Nephromyces sp. ex Molgula occidentalis]
MVRYLGPKLRILKTLGVSFLPGFSSKHITKLSKPILNKTHYFYCLKEKQKLRFNYGLSNKYIKKYINKLKLQQGIISLNLLKLLEMRLDSILFRVGFWKSINQSKQFINHGHIFVNKILIQSNNFNVKVNDIIYVKYNKSIYNLIKSNLKSYFQYLKNIQTNFLQFQICILSYKIKILRPINSRDIIFKINNLLFLENYKV